MSRSYKAPWVKGGGFPPKWAKRQAAKKVRRSDVDDGASYKRVYSSYDIHDYIFMDSRDKGIRK